MSQLRLLCALYLFFIHSSNSFILRHRPPDNTFHASPFLLSSSSPHSLSRSQTQRSSTVSLFSTMSTCSESTRKDFEGKTVLLTGATGGLGSAFALQLSQCGVSTLILSARSEESLFKLSQECKKVAGGRNHAPYQSPLTVHILACDLSDPASVSQLAEKSLKISPVIDVLINNGGVSSRSRFLDTTIQVDQQVMQINFFAGVALAKAVIPGMVQKGSGRIVWISSVQGLFGMPNRSSYAASKFAVQGYCESIRAELASSGVSVLVASPGYIRTNLSRSALTGDGGRYGKMDETTAAGADPMEVAIKILNLAAAGDADCIVAATTSAKAAIWLRLLCPALLRWQMIKRYEKSQKEKLE